jgi:hypothetical protein
MSEEFEPGGEWNMVLLGLVGSHAFGLAHEESDKDYLGVYQTETAKLLGLDRPEETHVHADPDFQYHELGKFCRLALGCNPTILELLWLPEYLVENSVGSTLVGLRHEFLSDRARDAFGGYARQQVERMKRATSDTKSEKNARHVFRLITEGYDLLTTGEMSVKVRDPESLLALSRLPFDERIERFEREIQRLNEAKSILPPQPNKERINGFLTETRLAACPADPIMEEKLDNAKETIRMMRRMVGMPGRSFGEGL